MPCGPAGIERRVREPWAGGDRGVSFDGGPAARNRRTRCARRRRTAARPGPQAAPVRQRNS
jgi:hypothetical protein